MPDSRRSSSDTETPAHADDAFLTDPTTPKLLESATGGGFTKIMLRTKQSQFGCLTADSGSALLHQLSVETNHGTNNTPKPGIRAFDALGFSRSWVTVTTTGPAPVRAVTSRGKRYACEPP